MTEEVTPCPRCGANNEVHRLFCSRCAAELVAGASAEVEPPRAGGRIARSLDVVGLGIHQRWDGLCHRLCQAVPGTSGLVRSARRGLLIAASLLPGLGHLLLGRRRVGLGLLAAFLLATGVWFGFIGTFTGGIGTFCMVSLIGSSVLDILRMAPTGEGRHPSVRVWEVVMAAAIVGGVYAGAIWAGSAVWERATINQPILRLNPEGVRGAVAFQTGDRLLVRRAAYRSRAPSRGDVVLAQVDRMLSIQRVIAVSGDRLGIEDGFLVLNDMPLPTEAYPLQPASPVEIRGGRLIQPSESVRVGRGRVAVWGVQGGDELVWLGPRVIDEEAIQGKAWVVYSPYRNRRVIDHSDPVLKRGGGDGTADS